MHLKTRVAGLVAATALSISLASGAMAQTSTGSQVVLEEGACAPGISAATVDFGTYVYDVETSTYVPETAGTDGQSQFTVSEVGGNRQDDCEIRITATSLTSTANALSIDITITESDNVSNTSKSSATEEDAEITVTVASGDSQAVNASLHAFVGGVLTPGAYSGDITVEVGSGS